MNSDNITFGRYTPYNTITHRLDPRSKIFLLILLMVTVFLPFTLWSTSLIISFLLLLLFITVMAISKVSFLDLFNSIKGMWFLIIVLMIVYIFIPNSAYENVAFSIGSFNIYWESICQSIYIIFRLILMLSLTMVLTSTTKPMDLTYGLEWYMAPLKVVHFPSHEIAMTLSIALRFIPTLLDETKRIIKAQSSRGVDFDRGGLFKRFRAIIALIVPLFVSAIERSEELSDAMEIRGYDPRGKRSKYHQLKFSFRDLIALIVVLLLFGAILTLSILDGYYKFDFINMIFNVSSEFMGAIRK